MGVSWSAQVVQALTALGITGELDGDVVSIKVEDLVTCDVEHNRSTGTYVVTQRMWDRTGGLASETELATARRARHAAAVVKDVCDEASYEDEVEPS